MNKIISKFLLSTGMLAVAVYIAHVLIGGALWDEYQHLHRPISDLTGSGAPDRGLLLWFTNIYGVLALVFAISFTMFVASRRSVILLLGGISLILLHIVSISYSFFPQDLPGSEPTFAGMMHIVVTVLIVPFTILSPLLIGIGLRKEPRWQNLGRFSILCGMLILVFGGLTGYFFANKLSYFSLLERLNIGMLLIWTFVLSLSLSRKY